MSYHRATRKDGKVCCNSDVMYICMLFVFHQLQVDILLPLCAQIGLEASRDSETRQTTCLYKSHALLVTIHLLHNYYRKCLKNNYTRVTRVLVTHSLILSRLPNTNKVGKSCSCNESPPGYSLQIIIRNHGAKEAMRLASGSMYCLTQLPENVRLLPHAGQ